MGTATYTPDAIVAQTNLTGTVADIQDDPDNPDESWLLATTSGGTLLQASFPTPANNLTGTQEFKCYVRKNATLQNDVSFTISVAENGSTRGTSSTFTLTDTESPSLVSFQWNSALLTSLAGETVEIIVSQTGGDGGGPSSRRYLEIGAVEWNASFAETEVILIT